MPATIEIIAIETVHDSIHVRCFSSWTFCPILPFWV